MSAQSDEHVDAVAVEMTPEDMAEVMAERMVLAQREHAETMAYLHAKDGCPYLDTDEACPYCTDETELFV